MIKMTEILTQQPLSESLGDGQEAVIATGVKEDGTIQIARRSAAGLTVVEMTPGPDSTETQLFNVPGVYTSAAFSPDGRQLALGAQDGSIRIVEAGTGSQVLTVVQL
jgi:WD40 repeat protein